jgi:Holliday junction resolvase RusA-like endonuclease
VHRALAITPLVQTKVLWASLTGHPMTYGNKRAYIVKRSMGEPVAVLANRDPVNLKAWQDAFRQKILAVAPPEPLDGPLTVEVRFYLARPQWHFRRIDGRVSRELKPSAPDFPTKTPDDDKVARAVLDCLTKIWCRDDSYTVDLLVCKRWAEVGGPERTTVACVPGADLIQGIDAGHLRRGEVTP